MMMNFMSSPHLPSGTGWVLRPATAEDLPAVLTLYKEQIGRPGCVWTDDYPGEAELTADFSAGKLFIWGKGTDITGAVSVVPENVLDNLGFWEVPGKDSAEIARVCIRVSAQGQGFAQKMVGQLLDVLRINGWSAVHLIAACQNPAAVRVYEKLGFVNRGECFIFGHDYWGFELVF